MLLQGRVATYFSNRTTTRHRRLCEISVRSVTMNSMGARTSNMSNEYKGTVK